jgi:alkylation response protein AidB-like acyl-CoA dehydrogenase
LPAIRPRDLLTDDLLGRLHGADLPDGTAGVDAAAIATDFDLLREAGYLTVTLPKELGGLGCTLRQAACGQRRLAGVAPLTALAVSAHLYWTGAAADAGRSGDTSVRWMLDEAARGAIFGAGHGVPGKDLKFASPDSRCVQDGAGGCEFRSPAVLSSLTPDWDWLAVHALDESATTPRAAVLAFAGKGTTGKGTNRVTRVLPAGAPSDVFTASAIGWGCAVLASVEFSATRRTFRQAIALAGAQRRKSGHGGHPLDRWPVAEASLRLDTMKARIADVTHPWPLVPEPGPDLGGQHMISVYAMRREITEGSAAVRRLSAQIASARSASGGSAIAAR